MTHSPDVTGFDGVFQQRGSRSIDDSNGSRSGEFKSFIVRTVFLRLFRHQSNIGNGAHRRRIERTVLFAKIDRLGVKPRIAAVGNDRFRVLLLSVLVPHLAGGSNHCWHRSVNDHVAGYVQVRNPLVRIYHRDIRPILDRRRNIGSNSIRLLAR